MATENSTTELAIRKASSDVVANMQAQWAKVLPSICTPDRFARIALSCVNKNPVLGEALMTPSGKTTVLAALMTCAELGIEPDGRRAHLIAFKKKSGGFDITLIIDYKGLAELVMRSGDVSNIHADVVRENDEFEYDRGMVKVHKIDFRKPRGEMYAAYCIIRMKDGSEKSVAMSKEEIYMVRAKSSSYKAYVNKYVQSCVWTDEQCEPEMWKKTVFRNCSKWVPLSPEVRKAVEVSDKEEFIDTTAEVVGETCEGKTATKAKVDKLKAKIAASSPAPDEAPIDADIAGEEEGEESTERMLIRVIAETGAPVTLDNVVTYLREKKGMSVTVAINDLVDKKPVLDEVIRKNPAQIIKDTAEFVGG